ncbi:hypothetical protein TIFTF001_046636 [Ficus carica]|uniref:Uncharacterized protein n=1 Tax=Ficus carica TaxID=3494 RepID=A0AA88CS91_FICCA|nr:hypothetical protein TIFTF001_046636 [Ficus carica]
MSFFSGKGIKILKLPLCRNSDIGSDFSNIAGVGGGSLASVSGVEKVADNGEDLGWEGQPCAVVLCLVACKREAPRSKRDISGVFAKSTPIRISHGSRCSGEPDVGI